MMQKIQSVLSISFLVFIGMAFGQTDIGRSLFYHTVSWVRHNPVSNTVETVFEKTKDSTVKIKDKVETKVKEIKAEVHEKTSKVHKDINGFKITHMETKGKSFRMVAEKEGHKCEYFSSPGISYNRCNKTVVK